MTFLPLSKAREVVTVEPVIVLVSLAMVLVGPAYSAMVYEKVCQQRFSPTICQNLNNESLKEQENVVQTEASHWYFYSNLAFEIPSVIVAFYYGVLSDNISRKVALILPILSLSLAMLSDVINAVYMDAHVGFCLVTRILGGLFGGGVAFYMALFSFLGAITDEKSRSFRIGIVEGLGSVSFSVSLFLGGYILDNTSYTFVFSLGASLCILAALYTVFCIKEPFNEQNVKKESVRKSLCNIQHIKESVTCIFQRRKRRRRAFLLVTLLILILMTIGIGAIRSLGYLFVKRQPLSWSQTTYGIFEGYRCAVSGTFLLTAFPFLNKRLHIQDTTMLMVNGVGNICASLLFGASTTTWMIFLVPIVSMTYDVAWTCIRALISKMVEPREIGKGFAAMGVVQSLSGLLSHVTYNNLYPLTLDSWAGWCFVMAVPFQLVCMALLGWLHVSLKKTEVYCSLREEKTNPIDHDMRGQEEITPRVV